jgi:FkbM family methyltransferase
MSTQTNADEIHVFDNGVKVYKRHLLAIQLERYAKINLHEPEEEALFVEIIKGIDTEHGVFLNIGAAIGYYIILARRLHPTLEIHAFEPLLEHRLYMQENLDLNEISTEGIKIHNVAISSREGSAAFLQRSYGSSLIQEKHMRLQNTPAQLQTVVKVTMLDMFQKQLGKPIDFVQMDVQGFEFDVLAGSIQSMTNKLVKTWMVGTHSKDLHTACKKLLTSYGCEVVYDDLETKHQPDGILLARVE